MDLVDRAVIVTGEHGAHVRMAAEKRAEVFRVVEPAVRQRTDRVGAMMEDDERVPLRRGAESFVQGSQLSRAEVAVVLSPNTGIEKDELPGIFDKHAEAPDGASQQGGPISAGSS
jgi:hypothetical protein